MIANAAPSGLIGGVRGNGAGVVHEAHQVILNSNESAHVGLVKVVECVCVGGGGAERIVPVAAGRQPWQPL